MKKLVILSISFLFVFSAFSQKNPKGFKNKEQVFEYWAKRYNLDYTYQFLNFYDSIKNSQLTGKEKEGYEKYISSYNKLSPEIRYDDLNSVYIEASKALDTGWKGTKRTFINIDKTITNSKNFEEFVAANKELKYGYKKGKETKYLENKKNLNTIKEKYDTDLKTIDETIKNQATNHVNKEGENSKTEKEKVDDEKINTRNTPTTQKPRRKKNSKEEETGRSSSTFSFLVLFLGLILGGGLMFVLILRKIKEVLSVEYEKYKYEEDFHFKEDILPFIPVIRHLKKRKDELKIGKETLEKELLKKINIQNKKNASYAKQEVKQYQNIYQKQNKQKPVETQPKVEPVVQKKDEPKKIVEYYSIPKGDGCFQKRFAKSSFEPTRFYKIEYIEGKNVGKVSYISNQLHDRQAVNDYKSFLEPACEILNENNRDMANGVAFIEPGEVYLSGENWCINKNKMIKVKFV